MKTEKHLKLNHIKAIALVMVIFAACLACGFSACESSPDSVRSITLDAHEMSLHIEKNEIGTLGWTATTRNMTTYSGFVTWESSDENVVTVQSGIVTPIGLGHADVTVRIDGADDIYDTCRVYVLNEETLVVGVKDDVDNFGKYNPNVRGFEGMEIDLARKIATELCYGYVEYVTVTPENRIDCLDDGTVDCVIATFTITEERSELVNFSSPYYTDYVQALVLDSFTQKWTVPDTGEGISDISEAFEYIKSTYAEDENGNETYESLRVGYVTDTTAYDTFRTYCMNSGIALSDDMRGDFCVETPLADYSECESALEQGKIDLFLGDHSILASYARSKTVFLDDYFGAQDYGIATAKVKSGNEGSFGGAVVDDLSELGEEINAIIDEWIESGELDEFLSEYGLVRYRE